MASNAENVSIWWRHHGEVGFSIIDHSRTGRWSVIFQTAVRYRHIIKGAAIMTGVTLKIPPWARSITGLICCHKLSLVMMKLCAIGIFIVSVVICQWYSLKCIEWHKCHRDWAQMATVVQTTFSNALSSMKIAIFQCKISWWNIQ